MAKKKLKDTYKLPKTIDVCVLVEPCDIADIHPLLDMLENGCRRPDGKRIRLFPSLKMTDPCDTQMKAQALDRAHSVFLVLSDRAAVDLIEENGNESEYFTFIKAACERFKENKSRILPLFLSRIIEYEGLVGVAKFSTWSYKCKNEEVRMYMERVGSLQGLFVDPTDWDSKWENVNSFYEETHAELVPLTWFNFLKELDLSYIVRAASGTCCGTCFPICALCGICIGTKSTCWRQFKQGMLVGIIVFLLFVAAAFFIAGFKDDCMSEACEDDPNSFDKNEYFGIGSAFGVLAVIVGLAVRLSALSQSRKNLRIAGSNNDVEEGLVNIEVKHT